MSQGNDPVNALRTFRAMHVEERRRIVSEALESAKAMSEGVALGAGLRAVQEQIDMIDRALADERQLQALEAYNANMTARRETTGRFARLAAV